MKHAFLAVVLFSGAFAAGAAAEPAAGGKESKAVALALKLAQASLDRADRLEQLVKEEGGVEAMTVEIAALTKDLKKAQGSMNWAVTHGDEGARGAARKLSAASEMVAEKLGKLMKTVPEEVRDPLKKVARRAQAVHVDCENRITEIDSGKKADPFGEFMTPALPGAKDNPSRDAQMNTSGHR